VGLGVIIIHPLDDPGIGIDSGFQPHNGTGIELCCRGVALRGYSSQQNCSNVFNLWKDALILHEINSKKF
jgi:hypothetical protein